MLLPLYFVLTATSGPALELEGLEEEHVPETATQTATVTAEPPAKEEHTDLLATLAEKAAAIIDRTTIGGYGQVDFTAGGHQLSSFVAHRYVVFVYSRINEHISTATEIEFEFGGSPVKKDGILGFGEALLEFSVIDLSFAEWLNFRAGIILVPFGAYNLRHDAPTQDLTDRPIAYTTIVPTTWFETGAGFFGTVPLGESQRLTYELYVVNGLDARIFDGQGLRAAHGSHFEDNNHDKALVGRIAYSPTLGAEVGLSGYTGAYDLSGNRVNMVNADVTLRFGKLELLGEAVYAAIDDGFVEGFSASSPANTRDPVPTGMAGYYVQANYHFIVAPLWAVFPDWLQEATFTGIVRYEAKDTNVHYDSGAGDERKLTFGLNFRPIEAYVLKTDYQLGTHGTDGAGGAADVWTGNFWKNPEFTFLTSVAFLF